MTIDANSLPGGLTISGGSQNFRLFFNTGGSGLTLRGLTLANGGTTGFYGVGGAIFNSGTLTLTLCTLSSNSATYGTGIYNFSGTLTLTHCTISGNFVPGPSCCAAIFADFGTLVFNVNNTITAGNMPGNIQDLARVMTGANNLTNGNPLLAPLDNYGGPTRTMALLTGSPARHAAVGSTATSDQRGFPIVGTPDIGAYEAGTLSSNFNAFIWESLPAFATASDHAAGFDYDGDGVSNYDEWLNMTDPNNAASFIRILSLQATNSTNFVLRFSTVLNRTYTLWSATAVTGVFTNTGLPAIIGNGSPRAFTNVINTNTPRRFYKVQSTP